MYGPSWMGEGVKRYLGISHETDHSIVGKEMENRNIKYMMFQELENNYCTHRALYSWGPENKRNFEVGNINYLGYYEG